jgi:hypothetical protein
MVEPSPSYERFETEVLRNATEDLDLVLIAWWIANTLYPDEPLSARLAVAERAIRSLAYAGLIALYRDRQMNPDHEVFQGRLRRRSLALEHVDGRNRGP